MEAADSIHFHGDVETGWAWRPWVGRCRPPAAHLASGRAPPREDLRRHWGSVVARLRLRGCGSPARPAASLPSGAAPDPLCRPSGLAGRSDAAAALSA